MKKWCRKVIENQLWWLVVLLYSKNKNRNTYFDLLMLIIIITHSVLITPEYSGLDLNVVYATWPILDGMLYLATGDDFKSLSS